MSFFKKALSTIGIGAAKVDTLLSLDEFECGGVIHGEVQVKGGSVDQEINHIIIRHFCEYIEEVEDNAQKRKKQYQLSAVKISDAFTVHSDESLVFDFEFNMHPRAPLSIGQSRNWIVTDLDIDNALDKSDKDLFSVTPNVKQHTLLSSMETLGFRISEVKCEAAKLRGESIPFVQEFEFKPTAGDFYRKLDEVEIVMLNEQDHLGALFEIDRRARGFTGFLSEMLDMDESLVRWNITDEDLNDNFIDALHHLIESES
ncbi:sporulation protein [Shewanella sp. OPT22]|nr:sporulation protein [Shewanella sp. OPT22]